MTLWVKICGLSTAQDVDAAVSAGADAVGFVFHAASPRNVTPEVAAELARRVPASVAKIAVMRHPAAALVAHVCATLRPDAVQTDAADFAALTLPAGIAALPVYRTGALAPAQWPSRFLYEAADSGLGLRADWDEAARLAGRYQVILAGGLDPQSVVAAVRQVRPAGVDVSSGVESAPGKKDPRRIHEFVVAARAAAAPV